MDYKIIVLDLDGTLTNKDKVITPRTKEALMKRQVKLRPSPAITDEQSDAEDVEEVRGI